MVSLVIESLQLDNTDDILCTSWEVSDTMNFSNVLLESIEDDKNKLGILFKDDLDPNVKYYGRCRVLLTTGWTHWSNLDVVTVNLKGYMQQDEDLPSKLSTPILSTSTIDSEYHDGCLFTISAKGFSMVGTGRHTATNYFIVDVVTDEIVWSKLGIELEKEDIEVNDVILEDNRVYRIMANFIASTHDTSQIASKTIRIGGSGIELLTPPDTILPNQNNQIVISDPDSVDNVFTYEIILGSSEKLIKVYSTVDDDTHTLPSDILEENNIYILRIKNSQDIYKNIIITTF